MINQNQCQLGYKNKSLTLYFKRTSQKGGIFFPKYDPDYTIEFSEVETKPQYFHLDANKTDNGKVKKEDIEQMHNLPHAIKQSLGSVVLFPEVAMLNMNVMIHG